jgi:hypothetical protein
LGFAALYGATFLDNKLSAAILAGLGLITAGSLLNRVNAYYISSDDFFYQGTGSNEGNVGHALYEFDTKVR